MQHWMTGGRSAWVCIAIPFAAAVMSWSAPTRAQDFWMGAEELKLAFNGVTIDGHYSDGRHFTERYRDDSGLEYYEGPREVSGHWSVVSDTFCTIYANDPSGGCFRVARVGSNCFEFYFVARTEDQVRKREDGKPGWTARGWVKGRKATCQEEPIV